MNPIRTKWREVLAVIFFAGLVTILTTSRYFAQLLRKPDGYVFVGMTHYFEDFYYYLDQFYQGAHGGWLTVNNFTSEHFAPTLIYFNNIVLGKIGGFFGLESFQSYNVSLLILKFSFLCLSYIVLTKIFPTNTRYRFFAFLIFLFSTSFPIIGGLNGEENTVGPLIMFRVENTIMTRFNNIPNTYVVNILFLSLILFMQRFLYVFQSHVIEKDLVQVLKRFSKIVIPIIILTVLLALSDSAKASIAVASFVGVMIWNLPKKAIKKYILLCCVISSVIVIPYFLATSYIFATVDKDPVYQQAIAWDNIQYFDVLRKTKLPGFLVGFGLLGIMSILGMPKFLKKENKTIPERFAIIIAALSIIGYYSPGILSLWLPGFRFIFSSSYIFFAVSVLYGFMMLESILKRKILPVAIILYLLINLVTFRFSLEHEMQLPSPDDPEYHFTYMPDNLYKGFLALRNLEPKDAVVLANPNTSVDIMIPGLTGKKTYSGHFLMTYKSETKDKSVLAFLYEPQRPSDALAFLKKNNIRYIVKTIFSEHIKNLQKAYPFLKIVYENDMMTIFTYDWDNTI